MIKTIHSSSCFFLLSVSLFITTFGMEDREITEKDNFYKLLQAEHAPTFEQEEESEEEEEEEQELKTISTVTEEESKMLIKTIEYNKNLPAKELFNRIIKCLHKRLNKKEHKPKRTLWPTETRNDLYILCGNHKKKHLCIALLFPVQTIIGRIYACERLLQLSSPEKLARLKKYINHLQEHDLTQLTNNMQIIADKERALFWLWMANRKKGSEDQLERYVKQRSVNFPFRKSSSNTRVIGLANASLRDLAQENVITKLLAQLCTAFRNGSRKSTEYITTLQKLLREKVYDMCSLYLAVESINEELSLIPGFEKMHEKLARIQEYMKELTNFYNSLQQKDLSVIDELGILFVSYRYLYEIRDQLLNAHRLISKLDLLLSIVRLLNADSSNSSPKYSIADYQEGEPRLKLGGYWHPLLTTTERTRNDMALNSEDPHVIIISGAGGSGKTTAIKAIGLCIYLSRTMCIAPASECSHSLDLVLTCMNITDNMTTHLDENVLAAIEETLKDSEKRLLADLDRLPNKTEKQRLTELTKNGLTNFLKSIKENKGKGKFAANLEREAQIREFIKASSQQLLILMDEPCQGTNVQWENILAVTLMEFLKSHKSKIIAMLTTHLEKPIQLAQQQGQAYRPYYGHQDHTINRNRDGSDDISEVVRMLGNLGK